MNEQPPPSPAVVHGEAGTQEGPPPKQNSGIFIGIFLLFLGILVGLAINKTALLSNIRIPYLSATPTPTLLPTPTATLSRAEPKDWKTYADSTKGISFKYPENYSYVTLSNGVVMFLKNTTTDYENCKKDINLEGTPEFMNTTCWTKTVFNFSGGESLSKSEYDNKDLNPKIFTDSLGRSWATYVIQGETLNFDAYIAVNNKYYLIGFQSGLGNILEKPAQAQIFFNQILSTFKFIGQPIVTPAASYTCPPSGYVDCMPILTPEKQAACSGAAMAWYKANCPNFKGGAL
jgi:hypothetical protein